ncbi:hypothetical protein [Bosea sp. (in: a-proteobacteria)]|uniref:hypothetical protein n=1 Tax=Bosea sp. (in: a-proteobacteria) TaxID=1871050 RepID=UPI00260E5CA6|nr:hypothetical protein [Bosea sp. (in: a-proteobacteria)]MCO5091977.1 hypothetical protein [Bosea sp. (in: a-proteobacteria)]
MLHDKAVAAAMNAAFAVSESETWMFGLDESRAATGRARKAWAGGAREDWLTFAREHKDAPAEALWIRAGALGIHNGKTAWHALPTLILLAFTIFQKVFRDVSDALDEQARIDAARVEAEKRAEAALARAKLPPDLEGTPLEPLDDPMAPSAFARPAPAQPDGEGA